MANDMSMTQELIHAFENSRYQRALSGQEAVRHNTGRVMHSLTTKHPYLALGLGAMGVTAAVASGGILSAALFVPNVVSLGIAGMGFMMKKEEKAACEFLQNIAVRKTHAFAGFLDRKQVPEKEKEEALYQYLKKTSLKFGHFEDYLKKFPNAIHQIATTEPNGDLPLFRNQAVFRNEIMQNIYHRDGRNYGLLKSLKNALTGYEHRVIKYAEKLAAIRYADYQKYLQLEPKGDMTWLKYMNAQELKRKKAAAGLSENAQQADLQRTQEPLAEMRDVKAPQSNMKMKDILKKASLTQNTVNQNPAERIGMPKAAYPMNKTTDSIGQSTQLAQMMLRKKAEQR